MEGITSSHQYYSYDLKFSVVPWSPPMIAKFESSLPAGWGFASAALLHRGVEIGAIDQVGRVDGLPKKWVGKLEQ